MNDIPDKQETAFWVEGRVGRIHLNRPETLNSLTRGMCREMHRRLVDWAEDGSVRVVVVTGEGDRAFCAGGDVRAVTEAAKTDPVGARVFFGDEYRMDLAVAEFPKPYVSLIDGIVMGGGLGISVNGRYRVMSEHVMAAMPETGIGLLPDVGATAFLNDCPGRIGLYLGLTGARLDAADAIYAGLGTHFVPRGRQPALLKALVDAEYLGNDFDIVEGIIERFAGDPGPSKLSTQRHDIDRLFASDDVGQIVALLKQDGSDFATKTAAVLDRMSPTSLKITAKQLADNRTISVRDALILEYRMVSHVLRHHDFFEGVRAALVDKDRNPRWEPATLDGVTPDLVSAHFESLGEGELAFD